ncbi:hypothetical protein SARC_03479 [Sphaeroforma arctica JP610]|uniref:KH type-2 domain-containing protein n=1 Tax=Sphaeroforma arctica JP610 TaxID=667725 RepID=A0A0L0G7V1_9EUKA|nr:hypothetical protein SARC_03479 [Sphaeroforma arctica JP610]KNC84318.1 hypothetical protein SARC_03479 [Sphaeroforma arctica JP610]|eukprot:XP_014158220.1 hypothetical protein SARC_03479 [Sphaeroforma arctica JP610]
MKYTFQITDMPPLTRIEEVVREKLMMLGKELPYTTRSQISRIRRIDSGEIIINVDIIVKRKSQIKIVLGKRGCRIRIMRETVQAELSSMFNQFVNVDMQVKL